MPQAMASRSLISKVDGSPIWRASRDCSITQGRLEVSTRPFCTGPAMPKQATSGREPESYTYEHDVEQFFRHSPSVMNTNDT